MHHILALLPASVDRNCDLFLCIYAPNFDLFSLRYDANYIFQLLIIGRFNKQLPLYLYQSRKVDTKKIFLLFYFSKVDMGHFFKHLIFSKVDTGSFFHPFSFSKVDTSPECACLRRFRTNFGSSESTRFSNVFFLSNSPLKNRFR